MFETTYETLMSVQSAHQLLGDLRSIYHDCKLLQEKLALYQAGTDIVFNAAINAIFTVDERIDLNNMLANIDTLVAHWETDHRAALGLP